MPNFFAGVTIGHLHVPCALMKIANNECEVCHNLITVEKPAAMVLARRVDGRYGVRVHNGPCQKSGKVVHLPGGAPVKVDRIGYIHR